MALTDAFRSAVRRILERHPELRHVWADSGRAVRLEFPKTDEFGFDVAISVEGDNVLLQTDRGWHGHEEEVSEQKLSALLGLVRDMLSRQMRIRELRAGGEPYRWHLEAFDGSSWLTEQTAGLLFWNYLGRRSEHIFQNHQLPPRPLQQATPSQPAA